MSKIKNVVVMLLVLIVGLNIFTLNINALEFYEFYFFYTVVTDETGNNNYEPAGPIGYDQFKINGVTYYNNQPVALELGTTYVFEALYNKTYYENTWVAINGSDKNNFVEYTRAGDKITFKYLQKPSNPAFELFLQRKPKSQIPGLGGDGTTFLATNYRIYVLDQYNNPVDGVVYRNSRTIYIHGETTQYDEVTNSSGYGEYHINSYNAEYAFKIKGLPSGYSINEDDRTQYYMNRGDGLNWTLVFRVNNNNVSNDIVSDDNDSYNYGIFTPIVLGIKNIINTIFNPIFVFLGNVIDSLLDGLAYLFIPSESDLNDLVTEVTDLMDYKLGFVYDGIELVKTAYTDIRYSSPMAQLVVSKSDRESSIFKENIIINIDHDTMADNIGNLAYFIHDIVKLVHVFGIGVLAFGFFKRFIK